MSDPVKTATDAVSDVSRQTMGSAMENFSAATRAMQDLTTEIMLLSMDSMRHTGQAFEQMRSAKSLEEVLRIQSDFMRESFRQFSDRTQRIASLAVAMPQDVAKRAGAALQQAERQTEKAVSTATASASDALKVATVGLDTSVPGRPAS